MNIKCCECIRYSTSCPCEKPKLVLVQPVAIGSLYLKELSIHHIYQSGAPSSTSLELVIKPIDSSGHTCSS